VDLFRGHAGIGEGHYGTTSTTQGGKDTLRAMGQQAEEALRLHVRQQAAVAAFGQEALRNTDLTALMQEACAMLARLLHVDYCKVSELLPDGNRLLLRAGVGWKDGYVGRCMIELGSQSHSGYTLLSQTPVIVADLSHDPRFNAPLLCEHGVVSGLSVIIHGPDRPFGVLGVHTTKARLFILDDIHFLQAVANILGEVLIRQRTEAALRDSEAQYRLLFEANPHPMWVFDRETLRFPTINNAVVTHFGYSREEFLAMTA